MKSFFQYISESTLAPLTHIMSGPLEGGSTEHSYHSPIQTQNGTSNLWISHVEGPESSQEHELHFSVSDTTTPEMFQEKRKQMNQKDIAPSDVFYSIGSEKQDQSATKFHGPATMIHVMRQLQSVVEKIPTGHTIIAQAASSTKEDMERKTTAYRAIVGRWERMGLVRTIPSDVSHKITMVKV